ncbi:MAG: methylated-DNA--[protein]-cysteine S-methyltransferase [Chlamydiae bacterium]|nr:methylated-DNA--[protein]-cysteine S-methyltransferase [Chlamydiota bacterium]
MRFSKSAEFETPIGSMVAIGDDEFLYFLGFINSEFQGEPGTSSTTLSIQKELEQYFLGKLSSFQTPLFLEGTPFQKRVWEELRKIPFGETQSYADIACAIGKKTAYRAVARANSMNRLAILVPCHRVINTGGALGGYASGIERKKWLLKHERDFGGSFQVLAN